MTAENAREKAADLIDRLEEAALVCRLNAGKGITVTSWRAQIDMAETFEAALAALSGHPTEEIATGRDAEALPEGSILLDSNDDVFVKVSERGFELAGYAGRLGLSWIKYPARVVYEPAVVIPRDTTPTPKEEK